MEKQNLESEFIPYPLALRMKALGFDKACFGGWSHPFENNKNGFLQLNQECDYDIKAPTYYQAFKWFRNEHNIYHIILPSYSDNKIFKDRFFFEIAFDKKIRQELDYHKTYEEAELACLEKLLDIVEAKLKAT